MTESFADQSRGDPNVNVLIAPNQVGARHVLLLRHRVTQQLMLPNDLLDIDGGTKGDVWLDLRGESGISASSLPSRTIYFGRTQDGDESGGRASAHLRFAPYMTDGMTAGGRELLWTPLEEALRWPKGAPSIAQAWYGNHYAILGTANKYIENFDLTMQGGQAAHRRGEYEVALTKWRAAADILPDPMSQGRALRGWAASLDRLKRNQEAEEKARRALKLHRTYIDALPNSARSGIARELIETHGVLGRIMIGPIVEAERVGAATKEQNRAAAVDALAHFNYASEYVREVDLATPAPDQHKINLLSRFVIAQSLFGDPVEARHVARQAVNIARHSEAEVLPTADPNMHSIVRVQARHRAVIRAWAARGVSQLVRFGSPGRRLALEIAVSRAGL